MSVAQGQLEAAEHDQGPPKDPLMEFRCHVILTDREDKEHAHVFSADFNLAFLARLDFPTFAPEAGMVPLISIRHTTVPFKPYKTLYSRLAALILPEPHASHDADDEDVPRKKGSEREEDGVENIVQAGQDTVPTQQDGDGQVLTSAVPLPT